jgi:1-deoxy-D-xylulose-5-phosphate synthase
MLKNLKKLNLEKLDKACEKIREEIISSVCKNGGHIASSLGVVELSVALHYVFNSPKDSIIWDVGHQSYAHKILTGRSLDKLRKKKGISGFPKPDESKHDPFIAGHAGVSLSQASALSIADPKNYSIAVIGDGAMTSGVAYEAMNHAGALKKGNLIVILNDNEMSISKNVGAVSSFLNRNIINTSYYQKIRTEIKSLIKSFPLQKTFNINLLNIVDKIRSSAVNLIAPDVFFEALGFRYVGPFDGNDLEVLIKTFRNIPSKDSSDPLLIHIITKKGKGFHLAENNPCTFHGVSPFDKQTGKLNKTKKEESFMDVMGSALTKLAKKDKKIVAITAAMKEGTGLSDFAEKFPDRFFDVGIAEQHAVNFGVGLAKKGLKPVVALYSTFLQRSLDQIIHDVALNKLPMTFCIDRAGFVGEDGATHHGVFDYSFLQSVPNINILAPSSKNELKEMLKYSLSNNEIDFIRYPRGRVPCFNKGNKALDIKKGKVNLILENKLKNKKQVVIFAVGYSVYLAKLACEKILKNDKNISFKLYDSRFVKPLDKNQILKEVKKSNPIITVEENTKIGGFGSSVLKFIVEEAETVPSKFKILGVEDKFFNEGTQSELRKEAKIDEDSIYKEIKKLSK